MPWASTRSASAAHPQPALVAAAAGLPPLPPPLPPSTGCESDGEGAAAGRWARPSLAAKDLKHDSVWASASSSLWLRAPLTRAV